MPSNMRVLHNARVLQSCSDDKLYISAGDGRVFEIGGVLLDGESGGSNWDDIPFGEKQVEKVVQEQMVTAREVVVVPANPEYIVVDGVKYDYKRTGYMLSENKEIFGDVSLIKSAYENGSYIVESNTKYGWAMVADALSGIIYFDDDGYHDVHFIEVVTEIVKIDPKYLPNGGSTGFVVVRVDINGNPTCNMTRDEYNKHIRDFAISGGVFIYAREESHVSDGVYYECEQYFITSFAKDRMVLPHECPYSAIMFDSDDGTLIAELAGTGPM